MKRMEICSESKYVGAIQRFSVTKDLYVKYVLQQRNSYVELENYTNSWVHLPTCRLFVTGNSDKFYCAKKVALLVSLKIKCNFCRKGGKEKRKLQK